MMWQITLIRTGLILFGGKSTFSCQPYPSQAEFYLVGASKSWVCDPTLARIWPITRMALSTARAPTRVPLVVMVTSRYLTENTWNRAIWSSIMTKRNWWTAVRKRYTIVSNRMRWGVRSLHTLQSGLYVVQHGGHVVLQILLLCT